MDHLITVRECVAPADIAHFWDEKDKMLLRDIVPDGDIGEPLCDEDIAYFLGGEYHSTIEKFALREHNIMRRVFFDLDGREVGFALYCVYDSEDGKCFVLEFCVYPEFRCAGIGADCFEALRRRAESEGAEYFELNTHSRRSARFWQRQGFLLNGWDEYGVILLCRPPVRGVPFAVTEFTASDMSADGWQLRRLLNGYCAETGSDMPDDAAFDRLSQAMERGDMTFFAARRGYRIIGMCSVDNSFHASAGEKAYRHFFVEPAFRHNGAARLLARYAQSR